MTEAAPNLASESHTGTELPLRSAPLGTTAIATAPTSTSNSVERSLQEVMVHVDEGGLAEEEGEEEEEKGEEEDQAEEAVPPERVEVRNTVTPITASPHPAEDHAMQLVAAAAATATAQGEEGMGASQLAGFAQGFEVVSAKRSQPAAVCSPRLG